MVKIAGTKALTAGAIFLFFLVVAFMSVQIEASFPNTVRTTSDIEQFDIANVTITGGSEIESSTNWWDYAARILDVMFFGIFMFKAGIVLSLVNVFIFFPLRFILVWMIMEVIRGV